MTMNQSWYFDGPALSYEPPPRQHCEHCGGFLPDEDRAWNISTAYEALGEVDVVFITFDCPRCQKNTTVMIA